MSAVIKYAIVGATGKVGMATSQALRDAGVPVRAIVRDASKATRLDSIGCEVAEADLREVDSIAKAIEGVDAVQVILPPFPEAEDPHGEMMKTIGSLSSALERTQPRRLLAISDYGAHVSHDIGMPSVFHSFEKRLDRLGGHKIFLRSAEHMENLARLLPVAKASGVLPTFADSLDKAVPTVSAGDVGRISAQLLLLPLNTDRTQLLEKPIKAQSVPRSEWRSVLGGSSLARLLIKANEAQNKGGMVDVEPTSKEVKYGSTGLEEALWALLFPAQ